ncbi:MAG: carbonic anhydrase [Propionibacteriaceae bacterium]|nr:carbonic anhydrase [Propionibacteriaceae bacterium]
MSFDDLLAANERYAASFREGGFDGIAHAGVMMVTCMDSRLDPLRMIGLGVGDAKILRTPGAQLTDDALRGCILGAHLLGVSRIMIVPHTRCAMASGTDADIYAKFEQVTGVNARGFKFGADPNQLERLRSDISYLEHHPLIGERVEVGGFLYDVDTGRLRQVH